MTSNTVLQNLDLIDLLNERQRYVQRLTQEAWDNENDMHISRSEWYIIAQVYQKQLPISYVTKNIDISRQAIHKFIKNLSTNGLIEVHKMENNKKERCIALTDFGRECYEAKAAIKTRMEDKIAENLGNGQVEMLKSILRADWGL